MFKGASTSSFSFTRTVRIHVPAILLPFYGELRLALQDHVFLLLLMNHCARLFSDRLAFSRFDESFDLGRAQHELRSMDRLASPAICRRPGCGRSDAAPIPVVRTLQRDPGTSCKNTRSVSEVALVEFPVGVHSEAVSAVSVIAIARLSG